MTRFLLLASVVVVLSASLLDAVIPPLGVPIALICIWVLFRLRSAGWSDLGMGRPASWTRTLALGVGGALAIHAVMAFVVDPVVSAVAEAPSDLSRFDTIRGNWGMLLLYLTVTWTTAAFGEEMIWRGFALPSLAEVFGGTTVSWALALAVMAGLFGALHLYQGPTGMVKTGAVGLMLAGLYLATGRNLWPPILAHGFLNTAAFLLLFLGWA